LGILKDPMIGGFKNVSQAATNAAFTINGLQVTKNHNTGLTDVVGGLTINLLQETTSTVTLSVAPDSAAVKSKVQSFLDKFNDATGYIRNKMAVDTKTYTRGPLAGDSILSGLRMDLMTDLRAQVTGLSSGVPTSMAAIGISIDATTLQLKITDSAALDKALTDDPTGTAELLSAVMTKVSSTLAPLVNSTGITQHNIRSIDDQKSLIDDRIKRLEDMLPQKEAQYTGQYSAMYAQVNELNSLQGMLTSLNSVTIDYSA
jgi:flagellar hook-associated protein 2